MSTCRSNPSGAARGVVGVSRDGEDAVSQFSSQHNLQYRLVTDPQGEVGQRVGGRSVAGFYRRITVVVDPEGTVAAVIEDVQASRHAQQVLSVIDGA